MGTRATFSVESSHDALPGEACQGAQTRRERLLMGRLVRQTVGFVPHLPEAEPVRWRHVRAALAVAAAYARGDTFVRDAEELRWKESDRIGRLCEELSALGAAVEEYADGFTIHGGRLRGGDVHPHGDHRLAMALAVSGLASEQRVTVQGAEIIQESFPTFVETLRDLGADIQTWQE